MVLFEVVVDYLYFRVNFRSAQLVYLMGEAVSSSIGLQRQLKLSHYGLVEHYLEGHIRNRDLKTESAFCLDDPVSVRASYIVFFRILFYLFDSLNNIC